MSHFFAEFDQCGMPSCFIRKDTRVYYHPQTTFSPSELKPLGKCVGAIWMCNPGSAGWPPQRASWRAIPSDPTLDRVLKLYQKAVAVAGKQSAVKPHDYLLVLNCFYSVGPDPDAAFDEWRLSGCTYREAIYASAHFIVAAWGLAVPHGPLRQALNEIDVWIGESAGQPSADRLVVYIDPTLPHGASKVSSDLSSMWYPSHPNSRAFGNHSDDLAAALASYVLSDCESEDVLDLEE